MGAIAGYLGQIVSREELETVAASLGYRAHGGWESHPFPRGMLITGKDDKAFIPPWEQKLWDRGEEYLLCFTGRLDNGPDLRRELSRLGHRFYGSGDREVVLHAYSQWGQECLSHFHGGFAFVIFEQRSQRLFLARDKMGLCSLFYKEDRGSLLFGTEMKTILAFPGVEAELTREGAAQLVLFSPGRIPGCGIFRGIQELEPGCCGYFSHGKLRHFRYWQLLDGEHRENLQETADHVKALLLDSVKRQTAGEKQLGTLLSGGLDSSILTAICAGERSGEPLSTFSVDYRNNDRNFVPGKFLPDSDGAYIREMTEACRCRHHKTVLTPEDLASQLEKATLARDLPGMGDVDFSLMAFAGEVRNHVPMVLSGECADELFGGYPWFRDPKLQPEMGFPWAQNSRQRASLLNFPWPEEMAADACRDTCRRADILPEASPEDRKIKELQNLNQQWFMQTLLERNDRMTAEAGLQVRVPFCDDRLAQYLYRVPWSMKNLEGREKGLLRYAVRGLLPERVRLRKKSPYPKTFDPAYGELMAVRLNSLRQEDRPIWQLLSRDGLQALLDSRDGVPFYGQLMGRPQVMAWVLQTDWWLTHYRVTFCF